MVINADHQILLAVHFTDTLLDFALGFILLGGVMRLVGDNELRSEVM